MASTPKAVRNLLICGVAAASVVGGVILLADDDPHISPSPARSEPIAVAPVNANVDRALERVSPIPVPRDARGEPAPAPTSSRTAARSNGVIAPDDPDLAQLRALMAASDSVEAARFSGTWDEGEYGRRLPYMGLFDLSADEMELGIAFHERRMIDALRLSAKPEDVPGLESDLQYLKDSWRASAILHQRLEGIIQQIARGSFSTPREKAELSARRAALNGMVSSAVTAAANLMRRVYDKYQRKG